MTERTIVVPYSIFGKEVEREIEVRDLTDPQAKFLAGLFEVGGSISVNVNNDGHPKGLIYYNDSDPLKIELLKKLYGGVARPDPNERSWRWAVYGYAASELLAQIKEYAPHRRDSMEAFGMVYDPDIDYAQRARIGQLLHDYNHTPRSYPDVEEYDHVKDDPYFLAGAFYGRGIDYTFKDDAPLRFWSQNPVVLSAIGEPYSLAPYAIMNERWPRKPDARVPVSFRLEMKASAKADFLSRIKVPEVT